MTGTDTENRPGWSLRDRRAVGAVAVQFAINGMFGASIAPRLPELRDQIGVSTRTIGLFLTVTAVTGLAASISVGRIVRLLGTRRVMLVGGVAAAASLAVVGLGTSWPLVLVGLTGLMFFDVYVDVAMNMQGSWLSARRHHPIMNRLHGLWSVGCVIGGVVAGTLAGSTVSLRSHLLVTAAILAALSTAVTSMLLPVDERHADEVTIESDAERPPRQGTGRFFLAGMTAVVLETVGLSWAAFRVTDDLDGSSSAAALAYVAVVGGMAIGRFAGDHLEHWWGSDRLMRRSATLAVVGLAFAGIVPAEWLVVVAFLLGGLGIATLMPRLYDLAARAGNGGASGLGVLTAGIRTATIVAPATIAAVASAASVGLAIIVASALAGVGFLVTTRSARG
ncbi:MAG: MFS transporter [Ilumatobacteraceae bacterium]